MKQVKTTDMLSVVFLFVCFFKYKI